MNRIVLAILIAASVTACGKQISKEPELMTNTEEYFKAHGIVEGQPNELRIGKTLFRFPAGVGLNPYTDQETYRSIDGSPMTLSTKEGMDQRKYEKVNTPIVKGQADKVTFFLQPERDYAPNSSPFGGGVRVEIYHRQNRTWDGVNANLENYLKEIKGRKVIEHTVPGLREYVAPRPWIGSTFEDIRPEAKKASGYGHFFGCQPTPGFCFISYWNSTKGYMYQIVVDDLFVLEHWPELDSAVARFIGSVVDRSLLVGGLPFTLAIDGEAMSDCKWRLAA